ncbi:MAG: hypothetical protein JAY90_16130 [Candidatus Thiodiazotropha lotti]|nr:hypothetical protein [Candidatus Thiodiazotropha lotti]
MKSKLTVALPWVLSVLAFALLTLSEPSMANKFETIGGGVQGSTKIKVEYLITIAYVASAIFMIAGILAIALHNRNAQTLNYTMWKSSAAMFFILGIGMAVAGYYMS